MKTVVIHQPDFAPYLGFFHRFLKADLFIVLDHVQFVNGTSRSWTHRDKIKTPNGEQWLTLSTRKAPRDTPINEIELSTDVDWLSGNLNLLRNNYRKAAYFSEVMPQVEALYDSPPPLLADFNMRFIQWMMRALDLTVPLIFSHELSPVGQKNELLIDLLHKTGATHYLSGMGAKDYMDVSLFSAAGLVVEWQSFVHPIYPQQFGDFIPYLSTLDIFMNCGVDGARRILREIP